MKPFFLEHAQTNEVLPPVCQLLRHSDNQISAMVVFDTSLILVVEKTRSLYKCIVLRIMHLISLIQLGIFINFIQLIHSFRTQEKMPAPAAPIRLGVPTPYITSHGSKVARLHMYDWIVLVLLAVLDGVLNIIEPFHRFVGSEMMTDLRYPMKDNTVPFWAVPVIYCSFLVFVLPCQFP